MNPVPTFASETRRTLALAAPLVAGQLGQMLMGVADTVMIGHVSTVQLGASTFANSLIGVPYVFGIGLLTSVSVRVSNARGGNEPEEAGSMLRHGTWLALAFSTVLALGLAALVPWLAWFRQPPEVVARTPAYLLICSASLVPALATLAWKNFADALSRPWPPFFIMLGGVLLNVGLNWLWIFGHLGFPAWELEGAAWATFAARFATAAGLIVWLRASPTLRPWMPGRWLGAVSWSAIRRLLALGVPASLGLLTEVTAFATSALVVGSLGTDALAAHQVTLTCIATAFMVPLGLSMALTVRIGQLLGAGETHRMRRVFLGALLCGLGFMSATTLWFSLGGRGLAAAFVKDPAVIETAAGLFVVAGLFQLADGLQVLAAGALRGVHEVRVPAAIALVAYWGLALPVGSWLALRGGHGPRGMWIGLALGLAAAGTLLAARAWRSLAPRPRADVT